MSQVVVFVVLGGGGGGGGGAFGGVLAVWVFFWGLTRGVGCRD